MRKTLSQLHNTSQGRNKESDIDYDGLFRHVKNLKKVLLVSSGRTGSDFFQSLLDSHSEILQFTGTWFFHLWWKEAKCKENLSDLINEFIWHTYLCKHIAKFKSYYEKRERWEQLGINRNEFFEVDIDAFRNHMQNILAQEELNSKNFFLAVNLAYGLATNVDIKKTKIIFYHTHHIEKLKEFKEDFSNFDVICTTREPRNTLVSGMEHWKRYNPQIYTSNFFYRLLRRIFEESEPILQYTKNFKTLKLEDLHLFPREVLEEFCKMYGLRFEECMLESSYHGKKWWGDAVSEKYLDGFNKNIKEIKWKDRLFFYDNLLLECILEYRLEHYGYSLKNKMSKFYLPFTFILALLPMKYEINIFAFNLINRKSIRERVASIKHLMVFYVLRVTLYYRFIWKRNAKKTFLADFFMKRRL